MLAKTLRSCYSTRTCYSTRSCCSARTCSAFLRFAYLLVVACLVLVAAGSCKTNAPNGATTSNAAKPAKPANGDVSGSAVSRPWIYFIGNSITYVEDIPGRLDRLITNNGGYPTNAASSQSRNVASGEPRYSPNVATGEPRYSRNVATGEPKYSGYRQHVPGGSRLSQRVSARGDSVLIMDILLRKPRYIVLQEQSRGTDLVNVGNNTCNILPNYLALARASGSEIIIYQTWHAGSSSMSGRSNRSDFLKMAQDYRLAMTPIGQIWEQLDSGSGLLLADSVHQNALGAALYAAAFYYVLHPTAAKIPGLISQTGLTLTAADDDRYNQVVFAAARNTASYSTTLRGIATNANIYNGLVRCDLTPSTQTMAVTGLDDVGNNLETAIVIADGTGDAGDVGQPIRVDVPSYDMDIYRLPASLAGKNVTVTFGDITLSGSECVRCPFSDNRWRNTIFLADATGAAVPFQISSVGNAMTFTVPQALTFTYLGFLGGGIQTSGIGRDRFAEDGQFTFTLRVN